jgi:anti-sigma regulatory factor (Ser/Thr protein kinase)
MNEDLANLRDALTCKTDLPASNDFIVSTLSKGDVRTIASLIFDILNKDIQEDIIVNCLGVLAQLARNATWHGIVKKSISRKGRCPERYRKTLKAHMAAQPLDTNSLRREVQITLRGIQSATSVMGAGEMQEVIETKSFFKGVIQRTIAVSTHDTGIAQWNLANALGGAPPDKLVVDFGDSSHTYINGLTALVAYVKKHGLRPEIKCKCEETHNYLDKIGFLKAVSDCDPACLQYSHGSALVIQPIAGKTVNTLAHEIAQIIASQTQHIQHNYADLEVLFAELIENVARHAGHEAGGYVGAQVYPKQNKLGIAVADCGIGIRNSFEQGANQEAKKMLKEGINPLELACRALVTSKPDRQHAGYGLYITSEVVICNGGTFCITSNDQTLTRYIKKARRHSDPQNHTNWLGTWIGMIINLNRPIPLKDIYAHLPAPRGYTEEDFFV